MPRNSGFDGSQGEEETDDDDEENKSVKIEEDLDIKPNYLSKQVEALQKAY